MPTIATNMTAEEYFAMPEGPPWYQLIQGELVQDPGPDLSHQLIQGALHLLLANHVKSRRLGTVILAPLDVQLSDRDVFQPDLLFVSNAHEDRLHRRGVKGAPDLVVEILSPSTARRDLGIKCRIYREKGTAEAWFIDLERRRMLVYRFAEKAAEPVQEAGEDDLVRTPLLPDFELWPRVLFQEARQLG